MNWQELEESIKACAKCSLNELCTQKVIGDGPNNASIVFIGEAPGKEEDLTGKPFVGRAGKVLTQTLNQICLSRESVYITNIVKCRPPNNRDPTEQEKATCSPWLDIQLNLIKPKVIIALGRHSGAYLLAKYNIDKKPAEVRGQLIPINTLYGKTHIMIAYHPAATLYNPNLRETFKQQLLKVKEASI